MIKDRIVTLVQGFQNLLAFGRVFRFNVFEQELRSKLHTRVTVMTDSLIMQQRTVNILFMQLETFAKGGTILNCQSCTLAECR